MRAVAFTVDVDRDVNLACQGEICSISNGGKHPRFDSSARGLQMITGLLEEMGVRGTFFWEGRTAEVLSERMDVRDLMRHQEVALHGYDHEDFTGKETGIVLDRESTGAILDKGKAALDQVFGKGERGFRAPYQRVTDVLLDELRERNFLYDSSDTVELVNGKVRPYRNKNGLPEVPVCWSRDGRGKKIVSYLWPYHEGKRPITDYFDLVDGFRDGLLVIATHSWHPVESFCSGLRTKEDAERDMADLRRLLENIERSGCELTSIADHLRRKDAL
ncbi:MAG: Polysaccharide deacetylase [Methanomassiliicoccales archaeon PtaB.Bin215]|nr:MAG: Polysaccharide deacetylase [Methanomassiliicoccales archaeon PtaB.Bin215]